MACDAPQLRSCSDPVRPIRGPPGVAIVGTAPGLCVSVQELIRKGANGRDEDRATGYLFGTLDHTREVFDPKRDWKINFEDDE
jgi:hypothetical protein